MASASATAISMPKLGMTMEEGTVMDWPIEIGKPVEKGDIVLIIESEKAEIEIEAPASGFFRHIYIEEGETVPCGALLAAITETVDEAFDAEAFHTVEDRPETKGDGDLRVKGSSDVSQKSIEPKADVDKPVVPAARALAKKLGIDPQVVPGTGANGRISKQDIEAYVAAREGLISVGGNVSLEVLTDGTGDSVVLLPGLGTDASAFARLTPVLAEHYRVYGVNPRGVGLSDAPHDDVYEVSRTAQDAAAVYEGAAHVIGASLGAAAAIELALNHPERVKTLTLITPFLEVSPRLRAVGEGWRGMAAQATSEVLAASLLPWFFSSDFLADDKARMRTLRGLTQTVARVPARTLDRMIAGMSSWSKSREADLARIAVPTLVISAGEDLLAPHATSIIDGIPGAVCLVVEGAGHAVALESPDAVNRAIMEHLG
jgi:pyruvate dehydrogenase E2 component (dihydrolipoamide acetyltransferase)